MTRQKLRSRGESPREDQFVKGAPRNPVGIKSQTTQAHLRPPAEASPAELIAFRLAQNRALQTPSSAEPTRAVRSTTARGCKRLAKDRQCNPIHSQRKLSPPEPAPLQRTYPRG